MQGGVVAGECSARLHLLALRYVETACSCMRCGGAGAEEYSGIISDLFPSLPYPLPWYLSRNAMLTWFALAVAPLLPARTLGGLARVSAFKVTCSLLCMAALALLAVAAGLKGELARGRGGKGTGFWAQLGLGLDGVE
jgi:hypothetical protein